LNVNETSLVCFSPTVTLCVCVPSFSCHAFYGVGTRRQSLQLEVAVTSGDGVERMVEHPDKRVHPLVHVALERDHDFFVLKTWVCLMPASWCAMLNSRFCCGTACTLWSVLSLLAILERLAYLNAEDVRRVAAPFLIEHRGR
jgi:hypothetical protein